MDFEKFEAIWKELWAWIYKVLDFFGLDAADQYKEAE